MTLRVQNQTRSFDNRMSEYGRSYSMNFFLINLFNYLIEKKSNQEGSLEFHGNELHNVGEVR